MKGDSDAKEEASQEAAAVEEGAHEAVHGTAVRSHPRRAWVEWTREQRLIGRGSIPVPMVTHGGVWTAR